MKDDLKVEVNKPVHQLASKTLELLPRVRWYFCRPRDWISTNHGGILQFVTYW